jgi:2,4-dienoyl-CoA reductase-like NADH-dependent reductase (Old Yellow Enzyme family)
LGIWDDAHVSVLKRLVEVLHIEGAAVGIQLADGLRFTGKKPCDLSEPEIEGIIEDFVRGILRAFQAEVDLVELHGAHSYTLADFLSRRANTRTDAYGGPPARRAEIVRRIIRRASDRGARQGVVGVRINGDDFIAGGNTTLDACAIACELEGAGAAFIHVSAGARREEGESSCSVSRCEPAADFPDAANIHLAEAVKQAVKIPVIGVGKISNTGLATRLIGQGKCDLAAMGRAILADYDLPNKEKAGAHEQVRRCIYCNSCLKAIQLNQPVSCVLWEKRE